MGKLWGTDHHPDDVEPACRASMADLNVDYLDLYLIHWPTPFEVSKVAPLYLNDYENTTTYIDTTSYFTYLTERRR